MDMDTQDTITRLTFTIFLLSLKNVAETCSVFLSEINGFSRQNMNEKHTK